MIQPQCLLIFWINFGPFNLIFGQLRGFSVKIAYRDFSQKGCDKNFEPIICLPNFPPKEKVNISRAGGSTWFSMVLFHVNNWLGVSPISQIHTFVSSGFPATLLPSTLDPAL